MSENIKTIKEEDLQKVSGGFEDKRYGKSYSSKESETIPPGTKLLYTDTQDGYKPHKCTYVRYAGGSKIVLSPDNSECKEFFEEMNREEMSNMNHPVDGGTAYEIFYTTRSQNHLYNA